MLKPARWLLHVQTRHIAYNLLHCCHVPVHSKAKTSWFFNSLQVMSVHMCKCVFVGVWVTFGTLYVLLEP